MRALVLLAALLLIVPTIVPAQTADKGKDSQQKKKKQIDTTNMIFDFKPPKGFDAGAQPEAGIIRWKKDGAEITLVVADLFAGPRDKLYRALLEAAEKGKQFERVKKVRVKGGKAFYHLAKAPENPERSRTLRLVVIAKKKVINLDFTAPAKEFASVEPAFMKAMKTFKLK